MKFVFTEKKIQAGEEIKKYAEKKIGKIDRLFSSESTAYVTFATERGRDIAEVTLRNNGMYFRVSEKTGDMFASVDSAVGAIERQIRKNKTRLEKRLRDGAFDREILPSYEAAADTEESFEIVRTKRFAIKPMTSEEAVLQMNLLGHEFFVFRNQDDGNAFSVVYRRRDGGYGLIETSED